MYSLGEVQITCSFKYHPQFGDFDSSDSDDDESRPISSPLSVIGNDSVDLDDVDVAETEESTKNDDIDASDLEDTEDMSTTNVEAIIRFTVE